MTETEVTDVPRSEQAFDIVSRPKHYNSHPSGVEAVQVCELISFNLGNALKYLWRVGLKGDAVEDLSKSEWYLYRELGLVDRYPSMVRAGTDALDVTLALGVAVHDDGVLGDVLRELVGYARGGGVSHLRAMIRRVRGEIEQLEKETT